MEKIKKTEDEWKKRLTREQYQVMREQGTEPPFTGKYYKSNDKGLYLCAACGQELFDSGTKFDSGTGWPSFYAPVSEAKVGLNKDQSHGLKRTEVVCRRCGAHLGHVFDDGPEPTGKRFCINSVSLNFKKDGEKK